MSISSIPRSSRARIHHQCKARGLTFRKAVFTKALDLRENLLCELAIVAALEHAVQNAVVVHTERE